MLLEQLSGGGRQDQRARGRRPRRSAAGSARPTACARTPRRIEHVEGLPLGTRGGIARRAQRSRSTASTSSRSSCFAPTSARSAASSTRTSSRSRVDGQRVHLAPIGGDEPTSLRRNDNPTTAGDEIDARLQVRVPVKAGPHASASTFVAEVAGAHAAPPAAVPAQLGRHDRSHGPAARRARSSITGPFDATGSGDTPSRRRDLRLPPADAPAEEAPCARQILATLARRAYRGGRSPTPTCERLLEFYEARPAQTGTFETRHRSWRCARILASPKFVFRVEQRSRRRRARRRSYRISDLELASRLSFFLWSSIPDDELLDARGARAG